MSWLRSALPQKGVVSGTPLDGSTRSAYCFFPLQTSGFQGPCASSMGYVYFQPLLECRLAGSNGGLKRYKTFDYIIEND